MSNYFLSSFLIHVSDCIFHTVMDRRLNILIYLAVVFLFCQAQVHTTTQSQCKTSISLVNIESIVPSYRVDEGHYCATYMKVCAGVCHSVDRYMKDGEYLTKCECCQPITILKKQKITLVCLMRQGGKFRNYKKTLDFEFPEIQSCGCTPCRSKTSWTCSCDVRRMWPHMDRCRVLDKSEKIWVFCRSLLMRFPLLIFDVVNKPLFASSSLRFLFRFGSYESFIFF